MTRIVTIGEVPFALSLRLPDQGMPEILAFATPPVEPDALFEVERSSRINGMDIAVPSAVLLPTGGLGYFGWPALCGHRDGRDFVLAFGGWAVASATAGRPCSPASTRSRSSRSRSGSKAHAGGVLSMATVLTNRGQADYQLDRCMAATFLAPAGDLRS